MIKLITRIKALADENRLKLLSLLSTKNYCVKGLAKRLEISESAVSQHLKKLSEAKLIVGEKRSYWMHYAVNEEELIKLSDEIKGIIKNNNLVVQSECCKKE